MKRRREKKKHRFRNFLLLLLLIGGLWYYNTCTLETTTVEIADSRIQNDITIVQITDLHGATFGDENEKLIHTIENENPDLVVATGDMYTSGDETGKQVACTLLGNLAKSYPVYYVNGEHDNSQTFDVQLEEAGVDVLDYEMRTITIGETRLHLYGISNVYYTPTFDLSNAFTLDPAVYNILLAHISNFSAFADFGIDLSLCGDTHGGQVRLPYVGGMIHDDVYFPELQDGEISYVKGLYTEGSSKLFVSSGLGNFPVQVRFLNRPEVAVIHLRPANSNQNQK